MGNGTAVNWAAVVRGSVTSMATEWILKNDLSGFPLAAKMRVCFDQVTKGSLQMLRSWANIAVTDDAGNLRVNEPFNPSTAWTNRCTADFWTTPASILWFGTSSAQAAPGEAYLIDNLRIEVR